MERQEAVLDQPLKAWSFRSCVQYMCNYISDNEVLVHRQSEAFAKPRINMESDGRLGAFGQDKVNRSVKLHHSST